MLLNSVRPGAVVALIPTLCQQFIQQLTILSHIIILMVLPWTHVGIVIYNAKDEEEVLQAVAIFVTYANWGLMEDKRWSLLLFF